jgi:hypothetical protein
MVSPYLAEDDQRRPGRWKDVIQISLTKSLFRLCRNGKYTEQVMADESGEFSRRNRLMRHEVRKLTPAQRMARMEALQQQFFEQLRQSPDAFDRFWRRNLKKRAVHRGSEKPN